MSYVQHITAANTPQSEPVSDNQVENSAGGYTFQVDVFQRLERFLILGCEGGTYYASERKLTRENAKCVQEALAADPGRTVNMIVDVSTKGRAAKNDAAIFALALAAADPRSSNLALCALNQVCRIGTHLFQFVDAVNELRGWGKALRRAVSNWYLDKSPRQLAMQVTKYAQRGGWSHRDVLRLAHPTTNNPELNNVLKYVTQYDKWYQGFSGKIDFLETVVRAKSSTNPQEIVDLIQENGLVREHIPTELLNSPQVWEALLENMPATAMLRNLGKMTSLGLLSPLSDASNQVTMRLRDEEFVRRGRLHPFSILLALATYKEGKGFRGSLSWTPDQSIITALDAAFYSSFGALTATNKRFLLGIDVSGSMGWNFCGDSPVTCAMGAACMAMVAYRTEPQAYAFGFCNTFKDLGISPSDSLTSVLTTANDMTFGCTDCALPMTHALAHKIPVDVFCVYTDNETWAGNKHPHVALEEYRQAMGIDAKLIVIAMTATDFSIADPDDPGMLDVVGFDSSVPKVMAEFAKSQLASKIL